MAGNTALSCLLCGKSCISCGGGKCACGFDPLKAFLVNQVVTQAGQNIQDQDDKQKVKEMIFASTPVEEIVTYLASNWSQEKQQAKEKREVQEIKIVESKRQFIIKNAIESAQHKFSSLADNSMCEYCHCTRFYCKNTLCEVRGEMIRQGFLKEEL